MNDWKKAEKIVKDLVSGYLTSGSGNKNQRADVRSHGKALEVKQTSKAFIIIRKEWLDTLLSLGQDAALVLFFDLRGYVYYHSGKCITPQEWKSKKVWEESLPETLETDTSLWVLDNIESLRTW